VRTLLEKIARRAATGNPGQWMRELAKTWMQDDPAEVGQVATPAVGLRVMV
jgi:hypothetical protein